MSPKYLSYLDLSSNLLAGPLPNCWKKFQSLTVFNLANNSLSGRIPKSLGTLRQLTSMHLNNNNFSGEIPSLTLCRSLKFIDFGDNIIEGTLPTWVGDNLHHLIVLSLSSNRIQGSIPASLCNLSFLQVLDLSTNNITGEIPQCLGHIAALSNINFPRKTIFHSITAYYVSDDTGRSSFVDEMTLGWKGKNQEYGKILGLMTIIDLSGNHLSGGIPQSMTSLVALAGLNLSGNNFTGFIPNNIGHMQMLESLDLSRNNLFGRMPPSFSNLNFLAYMNLSFNNLSGEIPVSTQLQSFDPSAYVGNIGLCGPPLIKQCPPDVIPPSRSFDKNGTDEDELINFGFYISLWLGFFVGFWGVCGTLIVKSSWRYAYYQFFNNIYDWIYVKFAIFVAKMKRRFQVED